MPVTARETKEIFLKALDHESAEAREAFLLEACGDDEELLSQVRALLKSHEEEDEDYSFLDSSQHSSRSHVFPLSSLNREREADDIGTIGDYELLEVIGRGAMGVVYRANQVSLNREVAVKMIRGSFLSTESDVARFRQEAEAAANLKHPNIVPIYEIREIDDVVFFSMELLDGGSMSDRMKEMRRHPREAVAKLALIARAIHIAHINGIIHRDVKPSNILLDAKDQPYLTDFGLAKNTSSELGHTLSGHLIGTPRYMAPEQASKNESLTTLADVYSLGAVLYEILTGKPPFTGETLMEVLELLRESRPESPSSIVPDIDRDLETIAMKCLEKNPENRYSSANRLADELDRWLRGEPIEARPVGRLVRTKRWIQRQLVLSTLIALIVILLLTLAIGGPLSALRENRLKGEALALEAATADAKNRLRHELYASEMRLAFQISEQAEAIPQLHTLLDRWIPNAHQKKEDLRGWEWHYLKGLTRQGIFSSSSEGQRHARPAWIPGSDQLLIRYEKNPENSEIWNWKTGRKIKSLHVPSGSLSWKKDQRVRIISDDGSTHDLDLWTDAPPTSQPGPDFPEKLRISTGSWNSSGNYLTLVSNRSVHIWSRSSQAFLEPFDLPGYTTHIQWDRDGRRLAISGLYQGCFIWDSSDGQLTEIEAPQNYGSQGPLSWHPEKPWLAVGIHHNNTIRIWNIETQTLLHEINSPGNTHTLAWASRGNHLAIGGSEGVTRIWDPVRGQMVATFPPKEKGHDRVSYLVWSRDDKRLAAGFGSGRVQAWSLDQELRNSYPAVSRSNRAVWSPDNQRIVSTGLGKETGLHLVDLKSGEVKGLEKAHPWIFSLNWNAETDEILASTLSLDHFLLFQPDSTKNYQPAVPLKFEKQQTENFPRCLFDPTGSSLALLRPKFIEIRSYPDGEFQKIPVSFHTTEGHWSPDGRFLLALAEGGFYFIDATERSLIETVSWISGAGRASWSPDSKFIAIPHGTENKIGIWSPDSRSWVTEVSGHSGRVSCVSWSPDGSRLATAEGSSILLWDTRSWNLLGVMRKHRQLIRDISWSPDGNSLLSLGRDQLHIWKVKEPAGK